MIHRDFLLRQIQQMTAVLASVITGRRHGRHQEVLRELERIFREVTGADDPLHTLPVERVLAACTTSDGFHGEKALAMADLLTAQGDLLADEGDRAGACASRGRALALYRRVTQSDVTRLDVFDRIARLEEHTEECDEA